MFQNSGETPSKQITSTSRRTELLSKHMMFEIHHLPPTKGIERSGIFLILFAKLPAFGRETLALPCFDVAFVPNLREKEWLDTKHPHTHRIYGRYTYIYHKNHPNVTATIQSSHGSVRHAKRKFLFSGFWDKKVDQLLLKRGLPGVRDCL